MCVCVGPRIKFHNSTCEHKDSRTRRQRRQSSGNE